MTRYIEQDEPLTGTVSDSDPHVYDGERCTHCNVNVYDDSLYGPFECTRRAPISYTTETPRQQHQQKEQG